MKSCRASLVKSAKSPGRRSKISKPIFLDFCLTRIFPLHTIGVMNYAPGLAGMPPRSADPFISFHWTAVTPRLHLAASGARISRNDPPVNYV
jgi:hypothetical protein